MNEVSQQQKRTIHSHFLFFFFLSPSQWTKKPTYDKVKSTPSSLLSVSPHKLSNSMKPVKCSNNTVSKTDSNGNSMLENHLDDMSEKKDLEPKVGKILEDNEEELEMEDDKKTDDGDVITDDDTKIGGWEGIKEDKKVDEGKETKEDEKDVGI
ncbi:hypothetical protein MTR_5g096593 [Medicago truncatula]|uniref:Uncharacterized protein n=1 Tax=Medicago truncatula TaxID=3880 RepID=A0A072UFK4_MEDTR|nr:hypothetical protein MTR_5g096593 [Medicago truncatula]